MTADEMKDDERNKRFHELVDIDFVRTFTGEELREFRQLEAWRNEEKAKFYRELEEAKIAEGGEASVRLHKLLDAQVKLGTAIAVREIAYSGHIYTACLTDNDPFGYENCAQVDAYVDALEAEHRAAGAFSHAKRYYFDHLIFLRDGKNPE